MDDVRFGPLPVTISSQPVGRSVDAGATVTFSVGVCGPPPFTYQWQFAPAGGAPADIAGATNATFMLWNAQLSDAGQICVHQFGDLAHGSCVPFAQASSGPS